MCLKFNLHHHCITVNFLDPYPQYVGGVAEIVKALANVWAQLNESKLRKYVVKGGNSAVAKRLGFIMEMLGLGDVEKLRKVAVLAPCFSPLDPTLPRHGKYNRG